MTKIYCAYYRGDKALLEQVLPLLQEHQVTYMEQFEDSAAWWQAVLSKISACEIFIYLVTDEALAVPYCQAQLEEALRISKKVLPVIVRPLHPPYPEGIRADLRYEMQLRETVDLRKNINAQRAALDSQIARLLTLAAPPNPDNVPSPPTSAPSMSEPAPRSAWQKLSNLQKFGLLVGLSALVIVIIAFWASQVFL